MVHDQTICIDFHFAKPNLTISNLHLFEFTRLYAEVPFKWEMVDLCQVFQSELSQFASFVQLSCRSLLVCPRFDRSWLI